MVVRFSRIFRDYALCRFLERFDSSSIVSDNVIYLVSTKDEEVFIVKKKKKKRRACRVFCV